MPAFRLEPLRLNDRLAAELADLYQRVFSEPPYAGIAREGLEERFWRQAESPQFSGQVALDEAGNLLGFAYGWRSKPGQWWHDRVKDLLAPEGARYWLTDCFELADLAVRREARGQGIGGALHDGLLAAQVQQTAILSANPQAAPAYRLYLARGWQTVLEPTYYRQGNPAVRIMGLDLAGWRSRRQAG